MQVSCLIYATENEADKTSESFAFTQDEDSNDFTVVARDAIHTRACFHRRVQQPGERAECFISTLKDLSEHCELDTSQEENIFDRIVVGILDKELSRTLQLMA